MDYSDPTNKDTVSIFMRKLPATVSAQQHLGSILVNPGGPGNSGSSLIASVGQNLSAIVEGRYDIIGFDPRGVNLTGPSTACFDVEAKFMHQDYQIQLLGAPFPHLGGIAESTQVSHLSALQAGHHAGCVQNGNHQMLRSVGTVAMAQDMAKIVEALGEDGLNYWGFSYGTVLGATFAALRPDLVKRMVLDGVVDAELYFNDALKAIRSSMHDTHKTITGFLSTCVEAGPEYCAFAVPQDGSKQPETVEGLRKRLDALFARYGAEPLVVADSTGVGSGIIRATDIQSGFFHILYSPVHWSEAAKIIVQLERGNGAAAYCFLYQSFADIHPQPYDQNIFNRSMQVYGGSESQYPIMCGDSPLLNISDHEYASFIREIGKINQVGEQWALLAGECRGWSFRANQRYTGPWTTEKGLKKTRFPILFVSLDADPVTPLTSAVKMSRGFGKDSATLLVQQGYGHTSTANPSLCTFEHIHDYFLDGKVPPNGTHCTPEPGYIYPTNSTNAMHTTRSLSRRDAELLELVTRIHSAKSKVLPHAFGFKF